MASGNGAGQRRQGSSVLWHAAARFAAAAAEYRTKGNLEVRDEAYELPDTLAQIASGLQARAEANARESLDPALQAMYARIADSVMAAAQAARDLGPAFDAMHPERVRDLLQGSNPAGWDSVNNGR